MGIKNTKLFKKLFGKKSSRIPAHPPKATVIAKHEHELLEKHISTHALQILKKFNDHDYQAYLVGGGVRDLLLGLQPKDFDISTNAKPEQIKKIFRNCRLIGKRFRLAHIFFGRDIIEVSTFRAENTDASQHHQRSQHGIVTRDNVYGDIDDDAIRRDFTVNALYYTTTDHAILDFTNGMSDLKQRILRIIGEPRARYREDPVRILRAIRLATKLKFTIDPATAAPIKDMGHLLSHISKSRLFEETMKLFHNGNSVGSFALLQEYELLRYLLPPLDKLLKKEQSQGYTQKFLNTAFHNTDERIQLEKGVSPTFLLAVLFWPLLEIALKKLDKKKAADREAIEETISRVIGTELADLSIPRRLIAGMREIYSLQFSLESLSRKKISSTIQHKRFRAAYDLLLLRQEINKPLSKACQWWTTFQEASKAEKETMMNKLSPAKKEE